MASHPAACATLLLALLAAIAAAGCGGGSSSGKGSDVATAEGGAPDPDAAVDAPPAATPDGSGDRAGADAPSPDVSTDRPGSDTSPDRVGDAGPDVATADAAVTTAESRELTATFTIDSSSATTPIPYPAQHAFTARIDPGSATIQVGADGELASAPVSIVGNRLSTTRSFQLRGVTVDGNECGTPQLTYDTLVLTFGPGGTCAGTATGTAQVLRGDEIHRASFTFDGDLWLAAPGQAAQSHKLPNAIGPFTPVDATNLTLEVGNLDVGTGSLPLEFPLPPGTTDEVVLEIARPLLCGGPGPSIGYLIDDLRVE